MLWLGEEGFITFPQIGDNSKVRIHLILEFFPDLFDKRKQ
jgi:hypothetical protein